MSDPIMTVDQRLKWQLGELLFSNLVAAVQLDTLAAENTGLKAKVAEMQTPVESVEPVEQEKAAEVPG